MWTRSNTKNEDKRTQNETVKNGPDYPGHEGRIFRAGFSEVRPDFPGWRRGKTKLENWLEKLDTYDSKSRSDQRGIQPATKNLKKMQSRLWQTLILTLFGFLVDRMNTKNESMDGFVDAYRGNAGI